MSDSPPAPGQADSIRSHDSNDKNADKKKSRRPATNTDLRDMQVQEIRIDYSDCRADAPTGDFDTMPAKYISNAFKGGNDTKVARWRRYEEVDVQPDFGQTFQGNICTVEFTIPEDMGPPVLFYYHLTNFYQNHRRYVSSFYADQLKGDAQSSNSINGSDCGSTKEVAFDRDNGLPIYPCGLIANSMFNDTFSSPLQQNLQGSNDDSAVYEMKNNSRIAWASDKDLYGKTKYDPSEIMPPPNWREAFPDGYTEDNPPPDLREWQAFQVWMRTAGLPEFSKLYQRNDDEPMRAGTYQVNITDNFPTKAYKGSKSIVISTRTVMGGRNNFLGIAYVVVGGLCIVLGGVFTVTHLLKPRKLGDHTYLSWNNTPASQKGSATGGVLGGSSGAMASGRDLRPGEA
ncbi:hypothetical protein ACHAQH_000445 [Verticillium albo-atrum]